MYLLVRPPSVTISLALQEDLQLHCIVVGQPSPKRIWTKNGKAVTEESHIKINDEYSLFVSSVQRMDSGNYTCSAENMFGKDEITYSFLHHQWHYMFH
ncbi:lachesin-like [Schistocerca serialis cubense]|uniref:lachesin-like n=1 Tax=Schistocerca serialis cubense TaxID=2023355 RepID=UPI00214F02AC|nr:lachesin-like [Schistocerca serialis cubense]